MLPEMFGELARTTAPVPVIPLLKSEAASWATVTAAPALVCMSTLLAPPVDDRLEPVPPLVTDRTVPDQLELFTETVAEDAAVTNPLPLTVRMGMEDAPPKVPMLELTVAKVMAEGVLADPSNVTDHEASPVADIVLAVWSLVAVAMFPDV